MVRATTGGVLRSYRSNLMKSFIANNKARDTVLSQRNFDSYAEDPAAAAKAFRLRMSRLRVNSQYSVCNDTYWKYQTAFNSLQSIDQLIDTENGDGSALSTLKGTTLEMLNDPEGDARTQLGKVLKQIDESIVQMVNQKYGDDFIFAGADGHNVPFEIKNDKLYYRGVDVDAAIPDVAMNGDSPVEIDAAAGQTSAGSGVYLKTGTNALVSSAAVDADPASAPANLLKDNSGSYVKFNEEGEPDSAGEYYLDLDKAETITKEDYDQAVEDTEKLAYLMNEKRYVDIGLGFQENENGKLIESSAYNEAINGLTFLGYGLDEDGDPKNIYSIVQRLKGISESVPEEGKWSEDVYEEFRQMVLKLEDASSNFKTEFTNLDAGTKKLETNLSLLKENFYNLEEQTSEIEDVNMAEAISSFIWAEYCYNAALKVGNSILSQSLMDYLN